MSNTIQCPQCSHQFEMTEALLKQVNQQAQAEIETRLKSEREKMVRESEARLAEAAKLAAEERRKSEEASRKLREEAVAAAVRIEQERQTSQATLQAQREELNRQSLETLTKQLAEMQEQNQKLAESQRLAEINARQQAEAAAQLRITQVTGDIEQRLKQESELRTKELELQLESLRGQVAAANQRANQISQQNQGDALESFFEKQLRAVFPRDEVADVPTGVRGADVMLDVFNEVGTGCGRILFETKRTQNWSNAWIGKLREDLHRVNAHVGVIVTETLPKDIQGCGFKDGIWVADFSSAMTLIRSLRWGLMQVQLEKKVQQNAEQNASLLYGYVTSPEFRNRVVSIVGAHAALRDGINKERKAMEKNWKLRETQIGIVEQNVMAVLGSIEGNSGHRLEGVGDLELEDAGGSLLEDSE
jgi:hypothetical protein